MLMSCDFSAEGRMVYRFMPALHRAMLTCAVLFGRIVMVLMLGGLVLQTASAEEAAEEVPSMRHCDPDKEITFRGGILRVENDLFLNTDQDYTSGVSIAAISNDISGPLQSDCLPLPVRLHAQLIKWVNPDFWSDAENTAHTQNVVVKFGQSMYTPEDRYRTDLILDDRPYAGLLYVGLSWNRRRHNPDTDREMLDTREITLGVIGPSSLAEQSQNEVHDAIGSERFLGWDNQLNDEAAFQLAVDRKFKEFKGRGAVIPGFSIDMIPSIGVRLGNIETSATLGAEGRIGWNIPNDFGSYPIRPGAENRAPSAAAHDAIYDESDDFSSAIRRLWPGMHLFGMLETKLVAYDFSLDGNLFSSSHSVSRVPWVAQAGAGVSIHGIVKGHGIRLAAMRVYRTREFEEQREGSHSYGSIALNIEF